MPTKKKIPPTSDLEAIVTPPLPKGVEANAGDLALKAEAAQLDRAAKKHSIRRAALENKEMQDRLDQRKSYARKTFVMVAGWITAMYFLLLFQGFGWMHLGEKVLIAAVGSTTINVLGMLAIVLHGLFGTEKE